MNRRQFLSTTALLWQTSERPAPDLSNISYGSHERHVLDLWKAASPRPAPLVIHIHGGGFLRGDKGQVPPALLRTCLANGISLASINYRYSSQAPYPAPMHDGARAVQFLRSKAAEWNLNPRAFAATGGSAGAGISLWLAFHDDMAERSNPDPVRRQSTRLSTAGPVDGQTSYDPRVIANLIDGSAGAVEPLVRLYGLPPGQRDTQKAWRLYEDASPVTHLTRDDPPVFLYYSRPMLPLPPKDAQEGIHHPRFGSFLKEKMDRLGIPCELHLRDEYPEENPNPRMYGQMIAFFRRYFR